MSIIQSAVEIRDNPNYKNTDSNVWWDCMSFDYNGNHYDIAFEANYYGIGVRQFMVNGSWNSPVKSKYWNGVVEYCASNSLCGEREFKDGSIVQEFLFTPLGLKQPSQYKSFYANSAIIKFCKENNIEFKEWRY